MEKSKLARMQELVEILNKAGKAYYQDAEEIMSNYEYDRLYDELLDLEKELGTTLSNSPTVNVGYEVLSELPKERHERPMLSLDKTKDVAELEAFVGEQEALMSWKMDGLTIVLTYREGALYKAVTRGNGEVGEVVTANARVFRNIPLKMINQEIADADAKYKNPRNLCSGSVRQLNNEITARRNVKFYAFTLVQADGVEFHNSRKAQMEWLKSQGFQVVEYRMVTRDTVRAAVEEFAARIADNDFPSDGLVLTYDDIAYGASLGRTSKFPRDSYAFKWADEVRKTRLLEIEWSPSRTGLINPVAIFEPVELEGTTVSRASVHNISIMEDLELGAGDTIEVYKANMIIPQIARNLTRSGVKDIPSACPVCGGKTEIRQDGNARTLYCTNPDCQAKHVKSFALFVSRDALNIEGLSEATLEKFIGMGYIKEYADIFHLDRYQEEICQMEGFGEKSYQNLMDSIEKARTTTLARVIYGIGIPGIGLANAKMICREFHNDVETLLQAKEEDLSAISGVGEVLAGAFTGYFAQKDHVERFRNLLKELVIPEEEAGEAKQIFAGVNFVITGSLINNDVTSTSSKNKKANELGIPIISEETFLQMVREGGTAQAGE